MEPISKVLEVIFAEDFAGAEIVFLSVALESNEPPPRVPASIHLERSMPRLRAVVDSPDIDRDGLHGIGKSCPFHPRTWIRQAVVAIREPDFEWRQWKQLAAETA